VCGQIETNEAFVDIKHLKKYFNVHKGLLHAVDDVTLTIPKGKTLGLVGESGKGCHRPYRSYRRGSSF